ncbi:hypothetical protein [Streptomyces goshikiensis]|uniref:hypothetical protein n=1 Tax=Streptomyces goshikiensis TaxID=1942 RepID=UPI003668637C
MADRPAHHLFPDEPGGPSRELQLRAVDGLATFLARWEDPTPAGDGDNQGDVAESEER